MLPDRRVLCLALSFALSIPASACRSSKAGDPRCRATAETPVGLLLTWQRDPTTTMTIDWHTESGDEARASVCYKAAGDDEWLVIEASTSPWPYGERSIHRAELTALSPDSQYVFQVGEFGRAYRFRTMPASLESRPVIFAAGGDTLHLPQLLSKTNRAALEHDLDFVAFGGDLAYADGGSADGHILRWELWFDENLKSLVTEDGRVVPILAAVGNHEVVDGYHDQHPGYEPTDAWRAQIAPYYYAFFAFPGQPGYGRLDFGEYMSLVFLDTDHTGPIEGPQTEWLEGALEMLEAASVPHVFPIYHVPAFPSHRDPAGTVSTRVRETWVPLFEAHGIELAFEHHDHTYKRTHPIREGEIDEASGIVYVGDGAWGVITREGDHRDEWYIDRFESKRHAIVVTVDVEGRHARVIDEDGLEIDAF
jgi:acid phosphatase type 7